jgi:hypothetical protein
MSRRRRIAQALAATGVALLAAAGGEAQAATQMFKCIVGGRTIYQQQACAAEAEAPKASAAAASAPAAAAVASQPAGERRPRPASRPASSAPATPR